MALNAVRYPMVIISASGMATGGRVLHHLERCLPDHRNTVLFVGYQGAETRGRGGASAMVTAQLAANGQGTSVVMNTDLAVSGVVAQFGRTGIMQEVAQRMAQRFASCVDQELKAATAAT